MRIFVKDGPPLVTHHDGRQGILIATQEGEYVVAVVGGFNVWSASNVQRIDQAVAEVETDERLATPPRRCRDCRFGRWIGGPQGVSRCTWIEAQDEAGDRMPSWAHAELMQATGVVPDDTAEACPSFELEER